MLRGFRIQALEAAPRIRFWSFLEIPSWGSDRMAGKYGIALGSVTRTARVGVGLAQQRCSGLAEGFVVGVLLGEVGGGFEGGEGLEVGLGFDHGLTRGVDGLDRFDRGLVVGGLGECAELCEGEAVDLADEDGIHRGIEEVLEEGFVELWSVLLCVCVRLALHCAPLCLWWGLGEL
jgi:hypothetical protein